MTTGEKLKIYRESIGLSRQQLADGMHVSAELVRLLETNKKNIRPNHLDKIADFVKVARSNIADQLQLSAEAAQVESISINNLPSDAVRLRKRKFEFTAACEFTSLSEGEILVVMPLLDYNTLTSYSDRRLDHSYLSRLPKHSIIVSPREVGTYRAFRVAGDWMDNGSPQSIIAGQIVAGLAVETNLRQDRLNLHTYIDYVLVHRSEGILVRRITDHNLSKGKLVCQSLNESYQRFDVNLDDVFEIYQIIDARKKFGNI